MSSSFAEAINDLVFLERRFKGLIEAIPHLQKIESLEGYVKELETTVKTHQDSLLSLQALRAAAEESLKGLEMAQEKRKVELAAWVAEETQKAQEASKALLEAAEKEASDILQKASFEGNVIYAQIEDFKKNLAELEAQTAQAEDLYKKTQAKLLKIKESI
jgi:cell division septum initiation protein DivIVA